MRHHGWTQPLRLALPLLGAALVAAGCGGGDDAPTPADAPAPAQRSVPAPAATTRAAPATTPAAPASAPSTPAYGY